MSAQGQVQHNAAICSMPLSEHTGNEVCLVWAEQEDEIAEPIAHYKNGPQGNTIADYSADYRARYGSADPRRSLGTAGIEDHRDNRDPEDVYREMHPHTHTWPKGAEAFSTGAEIQLTEDQGWVERNGDE
jgi:hypothetical protein